ncbi:MAG: hypothetical protein KDC26_01025 [Armatimonadetes bacterium]|nr:hypothetical protein [Armatimonadota bacterium]
MTNRGKFFVIAVFALMGAWTTTTFLPQPLQNLYERMAVAQEETPNPLDAPKSQKPPKPEVEEESTGNETPSVGEESPGDEQVDPATPAVEGDETNASNEPTDTQETKPLVVSRQTHDQLSMEARGDAPINPMALGLLGAMIGAGIGSFLLRHIETGLKHWDKMPGGDRITIFIGSFLGLITGIIVSLPFQTVFQGTPMGSLVTLGLILGCCAVIISIFRQTSQYLPWETNPISRVKTGIKVLDTNVLIDGRILDLIRTGFVEGEIYVPNFVLLELQHIADSSDDLRRARGRRGLDILKLIQSEVEVTVGTHDRMAGTEKDEVDLRLVKLAKALGADLVSNDFNLNRVASIQEVRVLNINDLALAMRPNLLPGEYLEVKLIREGNQPGQGVGYLDDGTMVVVENGRHLIGSTAFVPVTQVIQTERGKMIFADADNELDPSETPPMRKRSRTSK